MHFSPSFPLSSFCFLVTRSKIAIVQFKKQNKTTVTNTLKKKERKDKSCNHLAVHTLGSQKQRIKKERLVYPHRHTAAVFFKIQVSCCHKRLSSGGS
jgi:hypothetical protein